MFHTIVAVLLHFNSFEKLTNYETLICWTVFLSLLFYTKCHQKGREIDFEIEFQKQASSLEVPIRLKKKTAKLNKPEKGHKVESFSNKVYYVSEKKLQEKTLLFKYCSKT